MNEAGAAAKLSPETAPTALTGWAISKVGCFCEQNSEWIPRPFCFSGRYSSIILGAVVVWIWHEKSKPVQCMGSI